MKTGILLHSMHIQNRQRVMPSFPFFESIHASARRAHLTYRRAERTIMTNRYRLEKLVHLACSWSSLAVALASPQLTSTTSHDVCHSQRLPRQYPSSSCHALLPAQSKILRREISSISLYCVHSFLVQSLQRSIPV